MLVSRVTSHMANQHTTVRADTNNHNSTETVQQYTTIRLSRHLPKQFTT